MRAYLNQLVTEIISELFEVEQDALVRRTQDVKHGHYQANAAMALAKRLKKNPREVATAIADALGARPEFKKVEVAGPGFINLTLSNAFLVERGTALLSDRKRSGVSPVPRPEKIVVDFSSPNIAKQMHVGHLRSTIIGAALVRILRFVGHEVIGDNHLGDWGTQYGLLIVGMREFGSDNALATSPIDELERIYKLASARAKEDETFAAAAREELRKLQAGDPENRATWERFVEASKASLNKNYARLGVTFDAWLGESAYDAMLPGVVEELLEKGIAREDNGAICVFFNEQAGEVDKQLKKSDVPFIVRKKDGAYLYSTTDIATVLYRRDEFHADRSIYVVGTPQRFHFKQLFQVMKLLAVEMELIHVAFGQILGMDGKIIKTRAGTSVRLSDLLDEAEQKARERITQAEFLRIPPEDLDDAVAAIGIGAVKWADLSQNRATDYQFDWDKLVAFSGNAGPYLQYQYARCESLFRKGEVDRDAIDGPLRLEEPQERALVFQLLQFEDQVRDSAKRLEPHLICDHLYDLAKAFSRFWDKCPILHDNKTTRASRLVLVELSRRQLRLGLDLL
ncbi:MAG: arginine--tRNA ligase, partial [Myxococcota bacterium]